MEKLKIQGGKPLHGTVGISGAKNAILPIMASSLLLSEPLILKNSSALEDVKMFSHLLRHMGVTVATQGEESLLLDSQTLENTFAPYDIVRVMRASILVLGPLLARFHQAKVSLPGGCAIGARPVDRHLSALKAMGAEISLKEGYIEARGELHGAEIEFDDVTVTGTENILMAATLAKGKTILHNAAIEPEVSDLAHCLIACGANIKGIGTSMLEIEGVESLRGTTHTVIGDRIEAMTYIIAAMMTRGSIRVNGVDPGHCQSAIDILKQAGGEFACGDDWISVDMHGKRPKAVNVTTAPYPGFATDLQAQLLALNAVAEGRSVVTETIFENRFMHVQELVRLGANLKVQHDHVICHGVEKLMGAEVMATDLRAAASLVLAGLAAEGTTVIDDIAHLDRGYLHMENKCHSLGVHIERVQAQTAPAEVTE